MPIYTSYEVMRRRKGGRIDPDHRADIALRFKTMYRNLGLDLPGCAQLLQVSGRTLHNWESGRHVIPFSAYKLLRLLNGMELPGKSWDGWRFHGDKLWSPEGRSFVGTDASWWSLLVRRAAMFDQLYAENAQLRADLAGRSVPGQAGMRERHELAGPQALGLSQYQQLAETPATEEKQGHNGAKTGSLGASGVQITMRYVGLEWSMGPKWGHNG